MLRTSIENPDPRHPKPSPLPVPNPSVSFWHSEPSEFLLGHRTTEQLPEYADVVIVGSGITGASAARYLTEGVAGSGLDVDSSDGKKRSVVMLEAREACWGATGRNGGHLQPLLFDRTPDIADFELKNCTEIARYIQTHAVPCEYRAVLGCRTFWTDSLLAEATDAVQRLKKEAPVIGKFVDVVTDKAELQKHQVAKTCPGATLTQGAASLWPYKYVSHVLESLIKSGELNLQTNTPVSTITATPEEEVSLSSPSGAARWRIETSRGSVNAYHVLLATNGYTSHLLPDFADLLVPCRGTMSALIPPKESTLLPNSYGMVGMGPKANPNSDDYLVQRPFSGVPNPKGHLMFGGGREAGVLESVGESDDSIVDPGCVKYLRRKLLDALELDGRTEGLEELEVEYAWSGIMCYSRDNNPWVGRVPESPGLWLCGGYTGHGMPNAGLCARAVVGMMGAEEWGRLGKYEELLVEKGMLPEGYLISEERVKRCKASLSVKEQDELGLYAV